MTLTMPSYVEQTPEGVWRVCGSRVSLDSLLAAYLSGLSPEGIQEAFPSLPLETIHGCLAFYLRNHAEMDAYLQRERVHFEQQRQALAGTNSPVIERLRRTRTATSVMAAEP